MNGLYKRYDVLRPKTFLQLPDQLKEITVIGRAASAGHYIIKDKAGYYSSIPYYLLHIHYKKKEEAAICQIVGKN